MSLPLITIDLTLISKTLLLIFLSYFLISLSPSFHFLKPSLSNSHCEPPLKRLGLIVPKMKDIIQKHRFETLRGEKERVSNVVNWSCYTICHFHLLITIVCSTCNHISVLRSYMACFLGVRVPRNVIKSFRSCQHGGNLCQQKWNHHNHKKTILKTEPVDWL